VDGGSTYDLGSGAAHAIAQEEPGKAGYCLRRPSRFSSRWWREIPSGVRTSEAGSRSLSARGIIASYGVRGNQHRLMKTWVFRSAAATTVTFATTSAGPRAASFASTRTWAVSKARHSDHGRAASRTRCNHLTLAESGQSVPEWKRSSQPAQDLGSDHENRFGQPGRFRKNAAVELAGMHGLELRNQNSQLCAPFTPHHA
jgi:hypothetical protein